MNCQSCNSDRIANVYAHASGNGSISYRGLTTDDYFQNIENVCSGDDMDITVCLDCGQLQGKWPVKDPVFEQECWQCEEVQEVPFGERLCPSCGDQFFDSRFQRQYFVSPFEHEPMEYGGRCEVKTPSIKCKLLVPFEFEGLPHRPIGHEMMANWVTDTHIGVTYMKYDLELRRGIEAELT